MRRWRASLAFAAAIIVLIIGAAMPAHATSSVIDGGRLGLVRVSEPEGALRALVILFADHAASARVDGAAARKLTAAGALVVEVDTDAYLAGLSALPDTCFNLGGDIEGLSRQLQHDRDTATYHSPILAGIGEGGALAEAILTQVPSATFAGAVSIDPAVTLPTDRALCPGAPAEPVAGGFSYGPFADLQGFWSVGLSSRASAAEADHLRRLAAGGTTFVRADLPARARPSQALVALILAQLGRDEDASGVAALPLIELPVATPSPVLAIVLSGDGGWRDLDKAIALHLQEMGVPTVGWDSLRYFWSRKTPDETAHALAQVMTAYLAKWKAAKVVLIGYSFGADVLPFAYNRLPAALRARVVLMSLLGFANKADFEITMGGWLGAAPSDDALPILPEVAKLPPGLIQCFYGEDEDDTLCPALTERGVAQIKTSGGHHFDGDYPALADHILAGLRERTR